METNIDSIPVTQDQNDADNNGQTQETQEVNDTDNNGPPKKRARNQRGRQKKKHDLSGVDVGENILLDILDNVKSVNSVDNVSSVNSVHSVHNVQMAHPNMEA